jgi:hypothetical protein
MFKHLVKSDPFQYTALRFGRALFMIICIGCLLAGCRPAPSPASQAANTVEARPTAATVADATATQAEPPTATIEAITVDPTATPTLPPETETDSAENSPETDPTVTPEPTTAPAEPPISSSGAGYALRFFGTGNDDVDRVKIFIDDPATNEPGPPVDIGATDFTLEWWLRANLDDNPAAAVECGWNVDWIYGNIVFDRDRFSAGRKFGISIAGGQVVYGMTGDGTGDFTLCSITNVADGQWHHIAVERRREDGYLWLFVDGRLEAEETGPEGDVSYPDDAQPGNYCAGPCVNSDPFLVIGAEKHDAGSAYPSFNGWIDEVQVSTTLRYTADFTPPVAPFQPDDQTVALWHFDEGDGTIAVDSTLGNLNPGQLRVGGPNQGPQWVVSDAPLTGSGN